MKSEAVVGVRALRTRLSAYLREVARGRTVIIGDRRRQPIARLVPVARSSDEAVLEQLADEGVIRRGVGKPGARPRIKPRRKGRSVSDIVIEERG
ncbi:MAG TPA: type II toxin-antitoxin system prevent-host-death family antitoxin [Candidatus Kryptonia bacterium]|nr:type II toxin-antitoxin system prevent-host-death family antitoxin [Candidatus Kryptonia bacterium]